MPSILIVLPHLERGDFDERRQERIHREHYVVRRTRALGWPCTICGLTYHSTVHTLGDEVGSLRFPVTNPSSVSRFDYLSRDLLAYIETHKPDLIIFKGMGYRLARWLALNSRHRFRIAFIAAGGTTDPLSAVADFILAETPVQISEKFSEHASKGRALVLPKLSFALETPTAIQKDFDIINVGIFNENKCQARLLPLAHRYRLVLVGDGALWPAVRKAAVPYGDAVSLPGNVPRAEVMSYIARSRLMVHAARYEGVARVVMEAFSCGVPVVASRRAMPGAFQNGVQGLLVEPDQLLEAAHELLANPSRLEAMSRAAQEFAAAQCNEDAVFAPILQMYGTVFASEPLFRGSISQVVEIRLRAAQMTAERWVKARAHDVGLRRDILRSGRRA
ncbi:MAG: glycosyltransferase family 4 protein [Burkholderiales bacterium]|nr:glycosyltransferase family 4 protein [Burkholderiales bacterium]